MRSLGIVSTWRPHAKLVRRLKAVAFEDHLCFVRGRGIAQGGEGADEGPEHMRTVDHVGSKDQMRSATNCRASLRDISAPHELTCHHCAC